MKDRYNLNLFVFGKESQPDYYDAQEITKEVYSASAICIVTLAIDFPEGTTYKYRKELEKKWIDLLPKLELVKTLSIRHRVSQEFFEAICEMKNLESLHFWTSTITDLSSITKLQRLRCLDLHSSRLVDISPLISLKNLKLLAITGSFKIQNYEVIGSMMQLVGLLLSGDSSSPKNLRINSLKPFGNLKNLKHLDLTLTSVVDKSYDTILEMGNLERFDITAAIPKQMREFIKNNHKNLKAGFFMDWDYEKSKFYDDKEW